METIKEEQKILVKYIREKDEYSAKLCFDKKGNPFAHLQKSKGKVIGCVVSTANGVVGWSLINKLDRPWITDYSEEQWNNFSKKEYAIAMEKNEWHEYSPKEQNELLIKTKNIAFNIAFNRSLKNESLTVEELEGKYFDIPASIHAEVDKMINRSKVYFK